MTFDDLSDNVAVIELSEIRGPTEVEFLVLLLLIRCGLLLQLWDSVIVLCFVVRYCVSILVLQSSR